MSDDAVGVRTMGAACDATRCGACGVQGEFEGNSLLRCDQCGVRVHQRCAGAYASSSLCRRCWAEEEGVCEPVALPQRRCQLCPNLGGPQVELEGSEFRLWAHVLCGAWVPEVWFDDEVAAHPLCGVRDTKVLLDRFKLRCAVCKRRGAGACIQCCSGRCLVAAHVTCALAAGLLMRANVAEGKVALEFFCKSHEPEPPVNPPTSLAVLGMCAPPPDSERSLLEELKALSEHEPELYPPVAEPRDSRQQAQPHQKHPMRRRGRPPKRALSDIDDDDDDFKMPGAASVPKRRLRRADGPRPCYDESAASDEEVVVAAAATVEKDNDEDGVNDEDDGGDVRRVSVGSGEEPPRRRRGRPPKLLRERLLRMSSHVSLGSLGSCASNISSSTPPLQPFRDIAQAVQQVSRDYFGKVTIGQVKDALSVATRWERLPAYPSAEPAGFPQDLKGMSVCSDFGAVKVDPDAFNWLFGGEGSDDMREVRLAPGRTPLLARAGWRHLPGSVMLCDKAQRAAFGMQALSLVEASGAERAGAASPAALAWNLVSLSASIAKAGRASALVYVPMLEAEGPEAAALLVAALARRLCEHGARVLRAASIEPPASHAGAAWDPASLLLFLRVPFEWWQTVRRLLGEAGCFRVRSESPGQLSHVTLCAQLGDVSWVDVEGAATAQRSIQLRLRLTNSDGFQVVGEGEGEGGGAGAGAPGLVAGLGLADLAGLSQRAPVSFSSGHLTAAEWTSSVPALDSGLLSQPQGQELTLLQSQAPKQPPPPPLDQTALDSARVANELAACVRRNQRLVAGLLARAERIVRLEQQRDAHCERVEREYFERVGKADEDEKAREEHDLNALCSVCHGGDSAFGNLIVICEDCEQGFHERCHVTKIDLQAPAWFCHNCAGRGARKQPRETTTLHQQMLLQQQQKQVQPQTQMQPQIPQVQQQLIQVQQQRQEQEQPQHEAGAAAAVSSQRHRVAARSPDSHADSPASSVTSLTSPDSVVAKSETGNQIRKRFDFARAVVSPSDHLDAPTPPLMVLAAQNALIRASLAASF
jgi:hypothetical protein